MPRYKTTENLCDACLTPVGHVDDTPETGEGLLDEGEKDTGLPPYWAEITVRIKQPNPDRLELEKAEAALQREVDKAMPEVLKKAESEKGSKLTKGERETIREMVEQQARNEAGLAEVDGDDEAVLVVEEETVILCQDHVPLLEGLGVKLAEGLILEGNVPPWAVPSKVETPAPAPAPAAAPDLGVVPVEGTTPEGEAPHAG